MPDTHAGSAVTVATPEASAAAATRPRPRRRRRLLMLSLAAAAIVTPGLLGMSLAFLPGGWIVVGGLALGLAAFGAVFDYFHWRFRRG